jgi:hypothetical protein
MEILEAFDLTGSCRDAAVLSGCSHHTVANYVAARQEGRLTPGRAERRAMLIDAFLPKLKEWVEHCVVGSADVGHDKLAAPGYAGSERTTRQAVAEVKSAYRSGRRRVHRPWIPEPGCGSGTTSVTAPAWMVLVRSYFARGWRGAGSGWCWRCSTRRCRR